MLECLPTELVITILQDAAEDAVNANDRGTAHSIALTDKLTHKIVRPLLFRRVVVTTDNVRLLRDVLRSADIAHLVLDLCLTAHPFGGDHEPFARTLTRLKCLRGYSNNIQSALDGLSPSGRDSLYKLQIWEVDMLSSIPSSVTHVCLWMRSLNPPSRESVAGWVLHHTPLTHLAYELVLCQDEFSWDDRTFDPEDFAERVQAALEAGPQLAQLSFRLCGHISDENWQECLVALRAQADDAPENLRMGSRVYIWRDLRLLKNYADDMKTCIIDCMTGVDVWSEARALKELW